MRIDVISIFPDYFAPLALSLTGRAREQGLLDVAVHDLREFTHDRHRTVDDTPAGGGAGMVMTPEPWGEALDAVAHGGPTIVVPTPGGEPFTQRCARELSTRQHLVFCCGRYEGIDERVLEYAAELGEVREVSLGDYVLNGGEVATLAIIEAVGRLVPGFLGNAESLAEESHEHGLLEHPVYTRPASWRGRDVPPVLLSGDHAAVAAWRRDQARERTASRRTDLLHPSAVAGGWEIVPATPSDAPEIHTLQLACWVSEALANDDLAVPPLHDEPDDVVASVRECDTYVVRVGGRLVGSVRGVRDGEVWDIGRLMVAPDLRGQGLGRLLLAHIEACAPPGVTTYRLVTGKDSDANLRRYKRAGYSVREVRGGSSGPVVLTKRR